MASKFVLKKGSGPVGLADRAGEPAVTAGGVSRQRPAPRGAGQPAATTRSRYGKPLQRRN